MRACRPKNPPCLRAIAPPPRAPWSISSGRPSRSHRQAGGRQRVGVLTSRAREAADPVAAELHEGRPSGRQGRRTHRVGHDGLYVAISASSSPAPRTCRSTRRPRRARPVVFEEAEAVAVIGNELRIEPRSAVEAPPSETSRPPRPDIDDDAWVIFTSGSTGKPKGVAVTHRLPRPSSTPSRGCSSRTRPRPGRPGHGGPLGRHRRSCEEMWLAWPRGLPRPCAAIASAERGDLGPWLVANAIRWSGPATLVALWPRGSWTRCDC